MERLYFVCRVRLDRSDKLVIWYEDSRDGFVRLPDGRLLTSTTWDGLTTTATDTGISLVPNDLIEYDFDRIRGWCEQPATEGVECSAFLNAWNFFDDLAGLHTGVDSEYTRLSRAAATCYDKLFWGNNLPSVTPPGERFEPTWSPDDLAAIGRVFVAGLRLLRTELNGV